MKNILIIFLLILNFSFANFLSPEEAFKVKVTLKKNDILNIKIKLGKDIYLYADKLKFYLKNTDALKLEIPKLAKPKLKDGNLIYNENINIDIKLLRKSKDKIAKFTFTLEYQGCSYSGICYLPEKKSYTFDLDGGNKQKVKNEEIFYSSILKNSNIYISTLSFFTLGLLLCFTPCILPTIPILSGIILKKGNTISTKKGFLLSFIYVISMASSYAILGVIVGYLGETFATFLQNKYIILSFSIILFLLGISMLDLYEFKMPLFIQNKLIKLSNKGSGFLGVSMMGALSAIIMGPCIAAPVAGILIYLSNNSNFLLAGLMFFAFGLGMGLPLILITIGLKFIPKNHYYTNYLKYLFAFLIFLSSIWFLERILSPNIYMFLYALIFIIAGISFGALENLKDNKMFSKLLKSFAFLMLFYGCIIFITSFLGANNVLNPFKNLNINKKSTLKYTYANSYEEIQELLKNNDKPYAMISFYADWCLVCKQMEASTFSEEIVIKRLNKYLLIKVDVTKNTKNHKKILKKYSLFGPPAYLFLKKNNLKEEKDLRIIGYKDYKEFIKYLNILENI